MDNARRLLSSFLALLLIASVLPFSSHAIGASLLDLDPEGGYDGEYVIILNTNFPGEERLATGELKGLIDRDVPLFSYDGGFRRTEAPYRARKTPDLFTAGLSASNGYDLSGGDAWVKGFVRPFVLMDDMEDQTRRDILAMRVEHVGRHVRVWAPVNPAYIPPEAEACAQLGAWFDGIYPLAVETFGPVADPRGDGKVNLLMLDLVPPGLGGYVAPTDLFGKETLELSTGNFLPIIYIDTKGYAEAMAALGLPGEPGIEARRKVLITHELQHLIHLSSAYHLWVEDPEALRFITDPEDGTRLAWMEELLSAAAVQLLVPDEAAYSEIPQWYDLKTTRTDAEQFFAQHDDARTNSRYPLHRGASLFRWAGYADNYAFAHLLAKFILRQGGVDALAEAVKLWQEQEMDEDVPEPALFVAQALGYQDFNAFFQDLALYLLVPGNTGDADLDRWLKPPITIGSQLYLEPGGFAVIKPLGGKYAPPATAAEGLTYIGVTLAPEENTN